MNIAAQAILFLTHNHSRLGMRLQTHQPIDDMYTHALQFSGPFDIVLFIETRLQFHQYRYLLAILYRFQQHVDDRRVCSDAIQCLLNSQNVRIVGRRTDKIHHRIEAIVGVMHQDIMFANSGKEILLLAQCRRLARRERWVFEIWTFQAVQFHQVG